MFGRKNREPKEEPKRSSEPSYGVVQWRDANGCHRVGSYDAYLKSGGSFEGFDPR